MRKPSNIIFSQKLTNDNNILAVLTDNYFDYIIEPSLHIHNLNLKKGGRMKGFFVGIGKGLLIGLPVGILVYIIVVPLKGITNIILPLAKILLPGASPIIQEMVSFSLMLLFIGTIGCLIEFLHPIKRIKKLLLKMPLRRSSNQKEQVPEAFREKRVVSVKFGDLSLFAILTGELSVNNENKKPKKKVNIFIPTSPSIFTGFVLQVPPEKISVVENLSASEFFALVATYGIKCPPQVLKEVQFEKASLQ